MSQHENSNWVLFSVQCKCKVSARLFISPGLNQVIQTNTNIYFVSLPLSPPVLPKICCWLMHSLRNQPSVLPFPSAQKRKRHLFYLHHKRPRVLSLNVDLKWQKPFVHYKKSKMDSLKYMLATINLWECLDSDRSFPLFVSSHTNSFWGSLLGHSIIPVLLPLFRCGPLAFSSRFWQW